MIAVAVAAHAVAWFFKTPKETASDLDKRIATLMTEFDKRMTANETRHEVLAASHTQLQVRVEGVYSGHDQVLKNLTSAVEKLTVKFERFVESINGRRI